MKIEKPIDQNEWDQLAERQSAQIETKKKLEEKFKDVVKANGFFVDPDGATRFLNIDDAIVFKQLAQEMGLEVNVVGPDPVLVKQKAFLSEYTKVYPVRIIEGEEKIES